MKLFVDYELNNPNKASTGKGKFLLHLIPELEKLGIECKLEPNGCDVHLGISWFNTETNLPKVLRVDGLSFDKSPEAFEHSLKKSRKSVKKANAIIWQSKFCRKMLSQLFDTYGKRETVIFNGGNKTSFGFPDPTTLYKRNVLLSAHWYKKGHERTSKRLKESLEIIQEYIRNRKDVCFWIAGETNYRHNHPQVVNLGHISQPELDKYINVCNCMLCLAYYDWCPNSVVEALCGGLPVICSNNSGVAEIVGENGGTVLDLDKPLELNDMYLYKKHPPRVDREKVFKALDYYCANRIRVYKPELHIENIAKQYKQFLETI